MHICFPCQVLIVQLGELDLFVGIVRSYLGTNIIYGTNPKIASQYDFILNNANSIGLARSFAHMENPTVWFTIRGKLPETHYRSVRVSDEVSDILFQPVSTFIHTTTIIESNPYCVTPLYMTITLYILRYKCNIGYSVRY